MDDVLVLEIPVFQPMYKKWIKYGYRNAKEKQNLKEVLVGSSAGYCMYCYSRVRVDRKLFINLEHAIEKNNSDKLIECIPNIGVTCSICNQSFKRKDEKKRLLPEAVIKQYEKESKCTSEKRKQCKVPCSALRKLQKQYSASENGKIILQPMGVFGVDTKERLALQYDIMSLEFQPATNFYTYSEEEKRFIATHIKHFKLNDPKYKTRQLYDFIRNVIDGKGKIPQYEYGNLIVELFLKKLEDKSQEEILKICEKIFCRIFLKI